VHIEDIVRAFIAVVEAPLNLVHNEAFNVGRNEDNYQIRELAQIAADTVPGSKVEFASAADAEIRKKFDVGKDPRNYRVDCSKIQRVLPDFQPQWDARKGAQELYEAYKQIGVTLEDFEGPKYQRIAHIKELISSGRLNNELRWTSQPTAV
jgi:nucleoside-diphosphate-sugar epimerase